MAEPSAGAIRPPVNRTVDGLLKLLYPNREMPIEESS